MSFFIILLFLLTISNSYKMYFYFYLDNSISSLTIDNQLIFKDNDKEFVNGFHTLGPYDITLGPNKKIILVLYNRDNGAYGINGYIEINGYRFFTNNPLLRCTNCINLETEPNCCEKESNGIVYKGYNGSSDQKYFEFIFEIPENELELKEKSDQYEIDYNAKDFHIIVYQGGNIEINISIYIENKKQEINTELYTVNNAIYIEYLSNFKGSLNYINRTQIINNDCHSETNFIYIPQDNIEECYISQINFYSYSKITNKISSSAGTGSFYVCGKNCLTCENSSHSIGISCTDCKDGYIFVNDDHQKCVDKNTLIEKYYEKDSKNYYSCYESCLKCITKGDNNNHNCTLCNNYYIKKSDSNLNCLDNCPSEYPLKNNKECVNSCKEINLFYKDGNCINECSLYKKIIINSKEENECIDICNNYIIEGSPNECVEECPSIKPYISYDGKYCVNECNGEYPYYENNKCINYCNNDYYHIKDEYLCISECPNSHSFIIENEKICVNNCNDKYLYNKDDKKYCIDDCPINTYEYINNDEKNC